MDELNLLDLLKSRELEESITSAIKEGQLDELRLRELGESIVWFMMEYHLEEPESLKLKKLGELVVRTLENILELSELRQVEESITMMAAYDSTGFSIGQGQNSCLTSLPESISQLINLKDIIITNSKITSLPESIGQLTKLVYVSVTNNPLTHLPKSIGRLTEIKRLNLQSNRLTSLPESIGQLTSLADFYLQNNQLTSLPDSVGQLTNLQDLNLSNNQLTSLPDSVGQLRSLTTIHLDGNPLKDLSILQFLPKLSTVKFLNVKLPRCYWTKLSEWQPEWLLDEGNAEIRKALIQQIGHEKAQPYLPLIPLIHLEGLNHE